MIYRLWNDVDTCLYPKGNLSCQRFWPFLGEADLESLTEPAVASSRAYREVFGLNSKAMEISRDRVLRIHVLSCYVGNGTMIDICLCSIGQSVMLKFGLFREVESSPNLYAA